MLEVIYILLAILFAPTLFAVALAVLMLLILFLFYLLISVLFNLSIYYTAYKALKEKYYD